MKTLFLIFAIPFFIGISPICEAKDSAIFEIFSSGINSLKGQKYALHQFTGDDGLKVIVINGFKSAECEKLIDTFYSNLRVSCPNCRKDYGSCTTDLGKYESVWKNERYSSPYVSVGNLRFIPVGLSSPKALSWCGGIVDSYTRARQKAACVR